MQKNNIRPTKPVKNDAFLDNQVQIKVSAPQVEVEDPRFAGIGGSEIDKAIDEIEDLVEIEVKVKPKSSSKNQRPGLSGITKLPVNTHGYAKKGKQVDRLKPKIKKNNKLKAAKALKANSLQNKQLPQASKAKKMPSNLPGIQTTQYRGMT